MTSSSDNDDSTSTDSDDESVFYDANSTPTTHEILTSFQQEPRWRIPSKQDTSTLPPEHFCAISLTENQLHDIQRRDKLQRLRGVDTRHNSSITVKSATDSSSILSSTSVTTEHDANNEDASSLSSSSTVDPSVNYTDNEPNRINSKNSTSSISKTTAINSSVKSGAANWTSYPIRIAASARGTGGYYSSKRPLSTTSEPNLVDLNTIDRITRYGELHPNGRKLNDEEILQQPIVRNLDDGRYIPLNATNPMDLTIMERIRETESMVALRRNSLINSANNSRKKSTVSLPDKTHDDLSMSSESSSQTVARSILERQSSGSSFRRTTSFRKQLTNLVVRNILRKRQSKIGNHDDDEDDTERALINDGSNGDLKYKASRYLKEQTQFDKTQLLQTIVNAHDGPIWCMRFSPDGNLLATCGQDTLLKVWILKLAQPHFSEFSQLTSNASQQQNEILTNRLHEFHRTISIDTVTSTINTKLGLNELQAPLYTKPFCEFSGHQAPVLDVAWSKSLFLLSSSMDKTVRLWHLSRSECLCYFRHVDFVSAIAFHPRDDRFFVSASLDGHVRLWNIPDKRVVYWSLIPAQASSQIPAAHANLITAVNFCDDGRKVTVGTFDGRFLVYNDSLQYDTVMNIGDKDGSRSHRSRKKRKKPYKITGIESMSSDNAKVLITSNDSRIRLYNIRSKEIERKYRGYSNQSSQIRASFSHDDQYIISGSEDSWFYIWRTEPNTNDNNTPINSRLTRRQRRYFHRAYERIRVHNTMVTSAIFAPNPTAIMNYVYSPNESSPSLFRSTPAAQSPTNLSNNRARLNCVYRSMNSTNESSVTLNTGAVYVMITADSKGQLKMLVNRYHR
ncbi:unnamed protein product [Adineta ricciae]|uniref:WD repeat-containing protein 44 n=1 Tax=Adineta ricciae TaxID=249248 RepID=A0A815TSY0_ADIRI|nr:unnamed protein product [Adineta ricciae]